MKFRQIFAGILTAAITLNTIYFQSSIAKSIKMTASAEDFQNYEEYLSYNVIDEDGDGTEDYITISYCDDSVTAAVIPSEIEGLPVTAIDNNAFYECEKLISVAIPLSVTQIGDYAFYGCKTLSKISIPKNVEYIGSYAFYGCQSLISIAIPQYVTAINEAAFSQCVNLKTVSIENNVSVIDTCAFEGCYNLGIINIPEKVNTIGDSAFNSCSKLSSITINSPECNIYDYPTTICNSYDEDEDTYSFTGLIRGYSNSTAQKYAENYGYKFYSLGEYTPPATEETPEPTEPQEEEYDVSYELVDNNGDKKYDYVQITDCNKNIETINIPEIIEDLPVMSIDEYAFENATLLESIVIPASITNIGANAFLNCENLKNIDIPSSVKNIGEKAFSGTKWLSDKQAENPIVIVNTILIDGTTCTGNITIPDNVETIGIGAFMNCENLEDVKIPDSVIDIKEYAFYNCINLKNIIIPKSVESISDFAFDNGECTESITILNPECDIFDSNNTLRTNLICGYKNSTAQIYAESHNCEFKALDGDDEKVQIKGDISGNGYIDLYDAIEIAKYMIGVRKFTDAEMDIADINNDGRIDLYDAIMIAKEILENSSKK